VQKMMEYYFQGQLLSDWNTIFNNSIAPTLFKAMIQAIQIDVTTVNVTALDNYTGGQIYMTAYVNGRGGRTRMDITRIGFGTNEKPPGTSAGPTPNGPLQSLQVTPVTFDLISASLNYSTNHYNGVLFDRMLYIDLLNPAPQTFDAPERSEERRNPRVDDMYISNRLLQHLNSNIEYYNRVLWYGLDSNRRYMLLDGVKIETFDQFGRSEGYRSLASVVKNNLAGIVGNSLVFPVAPGYKVSQALVMRRDGDGNDGSQSLLDYYRPETPVPPYRISVPTRGVFMEAVQGSCDACEDVKPDSSQDWTKFTTDEPTAINPLTAPVPTVSQYKADLKDFAPPIVQIQNAPAAPEPGSGLAGVAALLGKSDIFKDVTGLNQNQKNALETFTKTQDSAKAFAQMAGSLATQSHNTEKSGQIMETIKGAQKDGTISKGDAGKLVKDHIQQQIDGGATLRSQLQKEQAAGKPSLSDAAVAAAGNAGKAVKASRTSDFEGAISESVDISPDPDGNAEGSFSDGSQSVAVSVKGQIDLVHQKSSDVCWAAAATMLVCWEQKKSMSVEDVMTLAGAQYLAKYQANSGLKAEEKPAFLSSLGLTYEEPASYIPQNYIDWMTTYGPLWVTTDSSSNNAVFSTHAKILIAIDSDDVKSGTNTIFTFLDPASKSPGPQKQNFADFEKSFEKVVTGKPGNAKAFKQVVHFAQPLPPTDSSS
jgi:hypothetical protein